MIGGRTDFRCRGARRWGAAALAALLGAACGPRQPEAVPRETAAAPRAPAATGEPSAAEPAPDPAPSLPMRDIVLVTDRAALAEVAAAGGELGAVLHGAVAGSNQELAQGARYAAIASVLGRDLSAIDRADPRAGVGIRGNIHRLFDARWLTSQQARYELIAVVPRLDLAPARDDTCGEIHLLYRLAYTATVSGEAVSSRLPMTLVAIFPGAPRQGDLAAGGCAAAARAWRVPEQEVPDGGALGRWLVSDAGPLGRGALAPARLDIVRVNLQSVRWPSSVRPDLGGHAEYILRAFRADAGGMSEAGLENTPDVERLRASRPLREALRAWIADNLDGIADGTARMPEEFLAYASVSVTPRGLSRRANRPYRQIFAPADLADIDVRGRPLIGSAEALLRRLDDLTCAGCHQARAIAGFHLLGDDGDDVAPGNALAVSMSPHLVDEVARRRALAHALAAGEPASFVRPFAERPARERGAVGARCGLAAGGEPDPGFADWTCGPGLLCAAYDAPADDRAVGTCLPAGEVDVGGPCEFGPISPNSDPHRDRARNRATGRCADGTVCNVNRTGFPGGMCTASCDALSSAGTCGVIALLEPFNSCLARRTPFPRCLAEHVRPAGMAACDLDRPCRDDYICARTPAGDGACIPPYFLFQMRVDGHP